MEGTMVVTYKILCDTDLNQEILLHDLLKNEKIVKAIKSEFAKGYRNITLSSNTDASIKLKTEKELHKVEVSKNDFADLLALAEEDARNNKLLKKGCERIEIVDIETL